MGKLNRRMFLTTATGAIALTVGTSVIWGTTRTPTKALAPWTNAGTSFGDVRLDALSYAVLAPSPHNRQPWKASLAGQDSLILYCDLKRRLPHTDPFDRQITIGLGCFIELLRIAANARGYQTEITPFPSGEPHEYTRLDHRPIAHIKFVAADVQIDSLYDAILERRSNKDPFTETPISPTLLAKLLKGNSAQGTVETEKLTDLKQTIYEGMSVEFGLNNTLKESADIMRFGKKEIEASPDGIDIGGAAVEALHHLGALTREQFSDPNSTMVADYLARVKSGFDTSQGFVWHTTENNTRATQLQTGAEYVRLNLKATQLGLAIHPVSQTLQEYAAMAPLYKHVHQQMGVTQPARLQMLARIGYANTPGPSPRWPVESLLFNANDASELS